MTSKSSSLIKPLSRRAILREMTMRRLWAVAFSLIPMLLVYPAACAVMLAGGRNYMNTMTQYGEVFDRKVYLSTRLASFFENGSVAVVVVVFLGILLGLQGFAFLFSTQQVDFFESQPMSRRQRFLRITSHSLLIFLTVELLSLFLTLLTGAALGALSEIVLYEAVYALIRDLCTFLAVYMVAVLAAMITGNLVYAIIICVYLLIYQITAAMVITDYMSRFFRTFAHGYTELGAPLSVPWHLTQIMRLHDEAGLVSVSGVTLTSPLVRFGNMLRTCAPHIFGLLLISLIMGALSYIAYKKRRAEDAGATLVAYPLHVAVKFGASVLGALLAGSFLRILSYGYGDDASSFFGLAVAVLMSAALIAMITEAMYRRGVRYALKGAVHLPVILALTYLILLVFKLDVIGYDRFTPTAARVESCALLSNTNYYYGDNVCIGENGDIIGSASDFAEKYMYLTDIDAIAELVMIDRETFGNLTEEEIYDIPGRDHTLLYRMKNGEKKYRTVRIPYAADEELMERIVGSEPYKNGSEQVCHDQALVSLASTTGRLLYDSGAQTREAEGALYEEFAECFRADLANRTYREMRDEQVEGYVLFEYTASNRSTRWISFSVYPSYEETIAFLKKHRLYTERYVSAEDVRSIDIEYGYETEQTQMINGEGYTDWQWETVRFTGKEEIEAILSALVSDRMLSPWFDRTRVLEQIYVTAINYDMEPGAVSSGMYHPADWTGRYLLKDRLPGFLEEYVR
ncbi:MAG: hypothetical protein IJQ12_07555 [Lachnospiraceae bacterium]|nr:hypothetical protein [Lachnospiraceae bacterium]